MDMADRIVEALALLGAFSVSTVALVIVCAVWAAVRDRVRRRRWRTERRRALAAIARKQRQRLARLEAVEGIWQAPDA